MKISSVLTYLSVFASLFISVQASAIEVPILMKASNSKTPPLPGRNYIMIGYWDMDDAKGNDKSLIFGDKNYNGGLGTFSTNGDYMASLGIDRRTLGLITELKVNASNKKFNIGSFIYHESDNTMRHKDNPKEYLVGMWDVDGGGGYGNDGSFGKYTMRLSARLRNNNTDRQLEDLMLVASNSKKPANRPGYVVVGYWDVDKGGSRGTDGSIGGYMMTLLAKWR